MKIAKYIFKAINIITLVALLLLVILNLSGCFEFRKSNAAKLKDFQKRELSIFPEHYNHLAYHINLIRTDTSNDQAKPVLIFIHGSPGSCMDFRKSLMDSVLRAHFTMISVDRPGFGHSNFGTPEPDLDLQVSALEPLLNNMAGRRVIVAGHSYGGALVSRAAMQYPEQISGCIIIAGSVSAADEPLESWRRILPHPLVRWLVPKAILVSNSEILQLKSGLIVMEKDWAKVEVPITVLQGTKDRLVSPANADFIEKMATGSRKLRVKRIEKTDHFIPFMQAELIREAAMEMLQDL